MVSGNKVTMRGGTTATGMVQNSGAVIPAGEVMLKGNTYILDSLAAERFQKTGQWYTAKQWRTTGQDTTSAFTLGKAVLDADRHPHDPPNQLTWSTRRSRKSCRLAQVGGEDGVHREEGVD